MMPVMLLIALAAAAQEGPILYTVDPPQGPMPGENRTLSQMHANSDDRMFPDLAVKDLRIDGDTLFVLVANEGKVRARGVRIAADAMAGGARVAAAPARLDRLMPGDSRWVPVKGFSVRTAASGPAPIFALQDAAIVSASATLPADVPSTLDRSGQSSGTAVDFNEANNSLARSGEAIARGRPD